MSLTNLGLVEFAKTKLGTPYVYGAKGKVLTQDQFDFFKRTYPQYTPAGDEKKIGKVCVDCSGLISWYTGILKSSTAFANESKPQPINTISLAPPGVAVWRKGHIGVYIGNGEIIEARSSAYGTVRTKVEQRDFTHWFKLLDIEYVEEGQEVVEKDKIIIEGKEFEVYMIRKDGVTYPNLRDIAPLLGFKVGNKGRVPTLDK